MTDKPAPKDEKAERLAAALRSNLRRRKAAARKSPPPPPVPAPEKGPDRDK